jgi:hypothetical protein
MAAPSLAWRSRKQSFQQGCSKRIRVHEPRPGKCDTDILQPPVDTQVRPHPIVRAARV